MIGVETAQAIFSIIIEAWLQWGHAMIGVETLRMGRSFWGCERFNGATP